MPTLYVIAGPNGIGKSTSFYDFVPEDIPTINSDEIAKEARAAGIVSVNTQEYSNREAMRIVDDYLQKRRTFAIETNLADNETWKFMLETRKLGYQLHLSYISTDNIGLLNERIKERTKLGDHYVRPDIVKQRYDAGLELLAHYFKEPDVLRLYDNSVRPALLAEFRRGKLSFHHLDLPAWIRNHFSGHLDNNGKPAAISKNFNSIDDVKQAYDRLKK